MLFINKCVFAPAEGNDEMVHDSWLMVNDFSVISV